MAKKTILIIAHGHPHFHKGGAEKAAFDLYQELRAQGEDAWFLAKTNQKPHGGAAFSAINDGREILFHTSMSDPFLFSNIQTRHLWNDFSDLLRTLKPDIIHCHHYFGLGIELFRIVKKTLSDTRLILTLHEYLAICHNNGQMITPGKSPKLCYKANTVDCHRCFPEKSAGDFFLRERYLKSLLGHVDAFISPSHFLKQRYVDWGLSESLIQVVENGQRPVKKPDLPPISEDRRIRIGYFGQVNKFKGLHILFDALSLLSKHDRNKLAIDVFGANLEHQDSDYQRVIKAALSENDDLVTFHGSYRSEDMASIIMNIDWTIMTSIWWENSPLVIQESFNLGRPVIVSNIGGMSEKVRHGIDGLHFRVGDAVDLARYLALVVSGPEIRNTLAGNIVQPPLLSDTVKELLSSVYCC